jgi:hypothetical protein
VSNLVACIIFLNDDRSRASSVPMVNALAELSDPQATLFLDYDTDRITLTVREWLDGNQEEMIPEGASLQYAVIAPRGGAPYRRLIPTRGTALTPFTSKEFDTDSLTEAALGLWKSHDAQESEPLNKVLFRELSPLLVKMSPASVLVTANQVHTNLTLTTSGLQLAGMQFVNYRDASALVFFSELQTAHKFGQSITTDKGLPNSSRRGVSIPICYFLEPCALTLNFKYLRGRYYEWLKCYSNHLLVFGALRDYVSNRVLRLSSDSEVQP